MNFKYIILFKYFIFILLINFLNSQSMYLNKTELRPVYSLNGNYNLCYDSDCSEYGLGISYVRNSNHEFGLLYNENSEDIKSIHMQYKYYMKFSQFFNFFIGNNYLTQIDNNDDSIESYEYGYYFNIEFEDIMYFPFISRTEYIDNIENSFTTIGLSMLFNDVGIQPEYSQSDNGTSFFRLKFYLWEFR